MERRGLVRVGTSLVAIAFALMVVLSASVSAAADAPPAPPNTVTEFFPESANLSDCVGLVEKPGCGSDARGGWGQTAVFVALFAGLGIVIWRVSRGIRANRRIIDGSVGPDAAVPDADRAARPHADDRYDPPK